MQAKARGLVAHEAEEAREWGVSGEVRLAPGGLRKGALAHPCAGLGRRVERDGAAVGLARRAGARRQ